MDSAARSETSSAIAAEQNRPRVVIVGAGFGGLAAATAWPAPRSTSR